VRLVLDLYFFQDESRILHPKTGDFAITYHFSGESKLKRRFQPPGFLSEGSWRFQPRTGGIWAEKCVSGFPLLGEILEILLEDHLSVSGGSLRKPHSEDG